MPADLPAIAVIAAARNAGVRLITQEKPLKHVHTPGKEPPNPTAGANFKFTLVGLICLRRGV
ncbi:MAG: hypothetical protein DME65_04515 [Verrucomicrobia bacterium]|nr:MAG: hypothetical protein DME65_04515 [Verrucomicrobiota bacterium]